MRRAAEITEKRTDYAFSRLDDNKETLVTIHNQFFLFIMFKVLAPQVRVKASIITVFCVFAVMWQYSKMCDNQVPPGGPGHERTHHSEGPTVE